MIQSGQISKLSMILSAFQEVLIKTEQVMVMTKYIKGFCSNQGNVTIQLMIQFGQVLNLSKISSMPTLSASFRKIWSKLNELCWWRSQIVAFSAIKGRVTLRLTTQSGQFLYFSEISSMSLLICKLKTEWLMLMTKSIRGFWPVFKLVRDFIHVHLISKFQEDLIKTEWLKLMTKSNRGFFSNQGDVTLRLMIRSGQFLKLSEILSMSTLSASFRNS